MNLHIRRRTNKQNQTLCHLTIPEYTLEQKIDYSEFVRLISHLKSNLAHTANTSLYPPQMVREFVATPEQLGATITQYNHNITVVIQE